MNPNKRPRPAIPLLVHVDNPTEAASVTVDTSAVEGKLNTVINNQERIYEKIPTSTGGGGGGTADMTTVNEKTTALADAVGTINSGQAADTLVGLGKNIRGALGHWNIELGPSETTVRSMLYNIRDSVGDATATPTTTGYSVRDLMVQQKNMSALMREATSSLAVVTGTTKDSIDANTIYGKLFRVASTLGNPNELPGNSSVYAFLNNIKTSIGSYGSVPSSTGNTVRDLLTAIKENTASGGGGGGGGGSADLTTVNEKTTQLATAIGTADDTSSTVSVIGLLININTFVFIELASLKVWHWFKNPVAAVDNFVNLFLLDGSDDIYITYLEPANWGIPAALFAMDPPAEFIGLLRIRLKKSDNSDHFFIRSFRHNSAVLEPGNIFMNIPFAFNALSSSDVRTYIMIANGAITLNHDTNSFQVRITSQQVYQPFTSTWVTVSGNDPTIRSVAVQGVNIYY